MHSWPFDSHCARACLSAIACYAFVMAAHAQSWPARPVHIVTADPGGSADNAGAFLDAALSHAKSYIVLPFADHCAQLALHRLPDSYFEEFVPKLSLVGADEVTEAARRYLDLEKMTTVVVGDVDKIQASLERLGLPVTMLST